METIEILSTVDRVEWNEARKGVPFIISALRLTNCWLPNINSLIQGRQV